VSAFWTDADDAELDVLVHALVADYLEHRELCAICATSEICPHVSKAISEVVEWRDARVLLSRAQALRRIEDAA